jgi:hypothetical protein
MGIESLNRSENERALSLFNACLEENHTVVAGWIGIAYAEAMLVSIDRNTMENIRGSGTRTWLERNR